MVEMKPMRPIRECGHPADCTWFWQDINGGIHVFCIPCLATMMQKMMGLKIYNYRNEEEFVKSFGGVKR